MAAQARLSLHMSKCHIVGNHMPMQLKTFMCLQGFTNNTSSDQPAHPRSLISAFVIHFLESIICKLATGEISIFSLVFVAEETGLKLALSETPRTGPFMCYFQPDWWINDFNVSTGCMAE